MHRHWIAPAVIAALAACDGNPAGSRPSMIDVGALAPGETFTAEGGGARALSVAGGAAGAEFTLVAWLGTESQSENLPLRVTATGVAAAPGAATPNRLPASSSSPPSGPADDAWVGHASTRFHRALRASEHEMRARIDPALPRSSSVERAAQSSPPVGALVAINTQSGGPPKSCSVPELRTGRVMAIGERAIVVADTANPANGYTSADYQGFALAFDTLVHPLAARHFGEPADIDGNGRIVLFFTREVNEMAAGGQVLGFFYGRDLLPRSSCQHSNAGEYIFMAVPYPSGAAGGAAYPRATAIETVEAVLVHELQHLISGSRRLYVHGATDPWEATWLNEGLSHIAEELLFHHASGLGPRRNLGVEALASSPAARRAFDRFQAANLRRYSIYLETTEEASPHMDVDDTAGRGAAWAMLRYAADHQDGSEAALWSRLVNSRSKGIDNLKQALGAERALTILRDWAVAVYADDALPRAVAAHGQPSWNFRSLLAASVGGGAPRFPLATRSLAEGTPEIVRLGARGSTSYLRFGVAPSGRAEIRLDTEGRGGLPDGLIVTVVRTK